MNHAALPIHLATNGKSGPNPVLIFPVLEKRVPVAYYS
jgi:hypothetical protein